MTYEIAPAAAGRHALAQPSPTRHGGFPLSQRAQRERAVFLDDCGPLPAGEVTDEGAEFQILALSLGALGERVARAASRVRGHAESATKGSVRKMRYDWRITNGSFEDWRSLFSVHHSAFIVYVKGPA
jgi:hypothetical protein